jgi:chromosome segregation ATPase
MIKKYWPIIAIVVGIALLIYFLLQGDKQHDSHKDDKADIVADHDTLATHKVVYIHDDDSLKKEITQLQTENKELKQGQATTRRQLDLKTAEVRTYLAQIKEINQDTGFFGHMLDSLQQQVESLTFLIGQYEQYADSINIVNDSLSTTFEARMNGKDKRIAELQTAYDKLYKAYMDLFKTSEGLMKDLRRQKLKTKIAAVLGAAGAVMLLLK